MNESLALAPLIIIAIVTALAIAAILMPIFVLIICNHCEKMAKTLKAMEYMMRHGK